MSESRDALRLVRHCQDPEPDPKRVEDMTVEELKAYAEAHSIDLGEATRKADILATIQAAPAAE